MKILLNRIAFLLSLVLVMSFQNCYANTDDIELLRKELKLLKQTYQQKIMLLEERLDELEQSDNELNETTEALAIEISQQGNQQSANSFNPGIGVILNGKFLSQSPSDFEFSIPGFFPADEIGPGDSGFSLGETELNLSANIDDKFYGSITLAFGDGEAAVEEAYLQTLDLPQGLGLKAGRFFSGIGYLSSRHSHTDDFSERPLPYEAFLGGQYGDDGIQLSWLANTELFWESGFELYRGDAFPAAGAKHNGIGTWSAFTHIGNDINQSMSWQAGISYLKSTVEDRASNIGVLFSGNSKLTIVDFVWKWAPDGNPSVNNAKIQGEYLSRKETGLFTDNINSVHDYAAAQDGWYLQGIYQFMPQWRVGLRFSSLNAEGLDSNFTDSILDNQGINPDRTSLMLDWTNSEFSRVRFQYSRDKSSLTNANIWTLQYIAAFGAHGAHSF